MTLTIAILSYAAAMLMANLSVAAWGPWVSPIGYAIRCEGSRRRTVGRTASPHCAPVVLRR